MTGFNLPPGVSVNDLPGNTPEDARFEELAERLDHATHAHGLYTHNRVSAILRIVMAEFGTAAANTLVDELNLTKRFGIRKVMHESS